jgi:uncharacterized protein with von Willebrand factor type A (vWA) domain
MESTESVENKLQELINQYNLGKVLTVDVVKDLVWDEEGDEAFDNFIQRTFGYFKGVKDINELNSILQVFNDAWNYFPHKSLNGKSPMQIVEESKNNQN